MPSRWKVGAMAVAVTGALAAGAVGAVGAQAWMGGASAGEPRLVSGTRDASGGPTVFGLTRDGQLVRFRAGNPGNTQRVGAIKGLTQDMRLVGIDFRVQDGKLYGVGDAGGIYTISTASGRATKVSRLTVALDGRRFGVDFNPAANRLRVVSDTGQNLRHNLDDPAGTPAAGMTATDTGLTTPPAATPTAGVTAAAYTNNDLDASTATTLFDVNTMTDQVVVQSPANQGELAPAGALGVDANGDAGLDIYSDLRAGRTRANTGYATLAVDGRQRFYQVALLTGRASLIGTFPSRSPVIDIAVALDR
jgi:hypothetical protein